MTSKVVDQIKRTGTSQSPMRQLVVVQGSGKDKVEVVLSTPIEKLTAPNAFRKGGGGNKPVEQYGFKVGAKRVYRFADATALVMRKHHITLAPNAEDVPLYVQHAIAILDGKEQLRPADLPTEANDGAAN